MAEKNVDDDRQTGRNNALGSRGRDMVGVKILILTMYDGFGALTNAWNACMASSAKEAASHENLRPWDRIMM